MEFIRIPKVERVKLIEQNAPNNLRSGIDGTLYLTATHLIFVNNDRSNEIWIVHTHISSVEKLSITTAGSPIVIKCKTFQVFTFMINDERDCHDLYSSLLKLSKPMRITELYAFSYNPRGTIKQEEGWDMFDLSLEFMRMGLPTKYWALSDINKEFKLCDTYPQVLCVPVAAKKDLLQGSAAFRSKGRLPVLSYLHSNGATISRCSQPLSGLNSRSTDDEMYVKIILNSNEKKHDFMYIVDTRPRNDRREDRTVCSKVVAAIGWNMNPGKYIDTKLRTNHHVVVIVKGGYIESYGDLVKINAVANRAQGKGYENTDFYDNIKYHFLGIDNIHVMRNSLLKLLEGYGLNSSGWLRHVHNVLQVSRFIANAVGVEGRNVLVHCSDGWDRTAQTCSLAAIMLNGHYRTIEGFLALVQKEWLSFGHKFTHRLGHLEGDPKEMSPVFTQFIDAVWQLMRIRPTAFQFNERLLLDIHDHAMSCQFGTFIGNCERERNHHKLKNKTYSLWAWMWKRISTYKNPLYDASTENRSNELLLPSPFPHSIRFWKGMYNRFDVGIHQRENMVEALAMLENENHLLEETINLLQKPIIENRTGIWKW